MRGGWREEAQARSREAMIASQRVAGNYNVVFPLSLSGSQPFTPSCFTCPCAQG